MSSELHTGEYRSPPDDALRSALEQVTKEYLGQPQVHTIEIGAIRKEGKETGEIGIVVKAEEKMSAQSLIAQGLEPLPYLIPIRCATPAGVPRTCEVRVDIQKVPQPKDQRLMLGNPEHARYAAEFMSPQAGVADWQQCFRGPIPGGVQIAPAGAGWVGTLSCALEFEFDGKRMIGAMTNYHVAVASETVGLKMGQPDGASGDWFAKLVRWSPMKGNQNRVDGAMLDTWRDDKPAYQPGRHMVKPEQFRIGKINPDPVLQHRIGDLVQKSGRTTGHQKGRVVGVEGTSQIDYGDKGVLQFVGQTSYRGLESTFSGPGDSGSLIVTMDNRPHGLLFAGGGGTTIGNQIKDVIEMFNIRFFAA